MKVLLFISLPILLAACATRHETVVRMTPADVPGTTLPSEGIETVRYAENIRAYSLGRYIDPNNSGIMHEGHTIYRVETTAKWNLHPNQPVAVPLGPINHIHDTARTRVLLRDELAAELNRQKEATKTVIQSEQTVSQKLGELSAAVQQTRKMAGQTAQLQQAVNTANQRLDLLEEELRKSQTKAPAAPKENQENEKSDW